MQELFDALIEPFLTLPWFLYLVLPLLFPLILFFYRRVEKKYSGNFVIGILFRFTDLFLYPACTLAIFLPILYLAPDPGSELIHELLGAALIFTVATLFNKGVRFFFWERAYVKITQHDYPVLLRLILSATVYIGSAYIVVAMVFQLPVTGFLVSTSIIAGVIGFSLQGILSDLFSGIVLSIDQPYRIGDWIELENGTLGKVSDISWRSTRLVSWYNNQYVIPNSRAAGSIIQNYDLPDRRYAMWYFISVSGVYPADTVKRILLEACISCRSIESNPPPSVRLADGEGQPYKYMVYVYFKDYPNHWAPRGELYTAIQSYLRKSDILVSKIQYEIDNVPAKKVEFQTPGVFELLRAQEIFTRLDEKHLELMSRDCEIKSFPAETIVFREGERGDSLFIVLSGVISVAITSGKKEVELERLGSGSCIGEMSLLTGNPRSATVKSFTDVELIEVPKSSISLVLKKKKEILEYFAESMATRQARKQTITLQNADRENHGVKQLLNKMRKYFNIQ